MQIQLDPLFCHGGNGHSGWGRGEVHGVLVPSYHLNLCLLNERWIGREEGLYCGPRLTRSLPPILLDARLDCADECPGVPLVPVISCRNPGVDKTPGFQ